MKKMKEAVFITTNGSANPSTFKNVGRTEKDADFINEWVAYNVEHQGRKMREEIEKTANNPSQAFLIEMGYDESHFDKYESSVYVCDASENYRANTPFGERVHNEQMIDSVKEGYSDAVEALEKAGIDYAMDWDEVVSTMEVNGELIYGEFTFHGESYFGYGFFH